MVRVWIASIFSLFLVASVNAQIVRTDFAADFAENYVILGGVQGTGSAAAGTAQFTLLQDLSNPANNSMEYFISLENVDLDGAQTADILDNITALHIHDVTKCAPAFSQCIEGTDTAGTIHLLNIFGLPRNDDAEVMVDPVAGTISGRWDVSDTSPDGTPVPTLDISDPMVIDTLMSGEAAIFVHTNEVATAASGGALRIVPEPSSSLLLVIASLISLGACRKRS